MVSSNKKMHQFLHRRNMQFARNVTLLQHIFAKNCVEFLRFTFIYKKNVAGFRRLFYWPFLPVHMYILRPGFNWSGWCRSGFNWFGGNEQGSSITVFIFVQIFIEFPDTAHFSAIWQRPFFAVSNHKIRGRSERQVCRYWQIFGF